MQQEEKFVIRLPYGMRDQIRTNAEANRRTMNAEILHYIDRAFMPETKTATSEPASSN
ncbi:MULTISPECIES: Arc family DNA-binding protein [unclassified Mesorhizobium]|uniref:Arc family DNA-binding protein n=1 Tax=unclassified Mesorhizobium TaxID=325217 RepID=UPI0018DCD127|nr:Arc family DNA-binding protein [Mesorhizobium sp. LSJC268A00]